MVKTDAATAEVSRSAASFRHLPVSIGQIAGAVPSAALQDCFQRIVSEHLRSKPSLRCKVVGLRSGQMSSGIGKVKHKNELSYRGGLAR